MSYEKVSISIWTNNSVLTEVLSGIGVTDIIFKKYTEQLKEDYLCLFLDLEIDIKNQYQEIQNIYLNAREKNKKISVILLPSINGSAEKLHITRSFLKEICTQNPTHRIIICQDLYFLSSKIPVTSLDSLILNVVSTKDFSISKKGDFFYYPISIESLIEVIKKSLYLSNTNGKEFFVEGEKISDLNLAYLIKERAQEDSKISIEIDNNKLVNTQRVSFVADSNQTSAVLNTNNLTEFDKDLSHYLKNIDTENEIGTTLQKRSLFFKIFHRFSKNKTLNTTETIKVLVRKNIISVLEKFIAFACIVYLSASLIFIFTAYNALTNIEKTLFSFKKGDFVKAGSLLKVSNNYLKVSELNYKIVSPLIRFFEPDLDSTNQNFLSFLNAIQSTFLGITQTASLTQGIYESINDSSKSLDYENLSHAIKTNLQLSYEYLNQLEILFTNKNLPQPLIQKIKQSTSIDQLKEGKEQLGELIKSIDLIPILVGNKKVSNVFVLLQNDNEQRSTGGVIENIFQISFEKGKVVSQKMYSAQEIDNLDNFTLTPPPLIEKITGETVWKLRDMNYNPDFPQTATNIAWYLEKKLKTKPDVIISLNVSVLKDILGENLTLPSPVTKETVESFDEKLKNGNGNLVTLEIFNELVKNTLEHKINLSELGKISSLALKKGGVYLWVSDKVVEKNILKQAYSGSIRDYYCHPAMSTSRKCISITSHLNFSNFSQIPLNNYLVKEIKQEVTPQTLSVDSQIIINYVYKKFTPLINRNLTEVVQLYLPKEAVLQSIKLNEATLPVDSTIVQAEATLNRYQFVLSTTLNSPQQLTISFTIPQNERTILPIAYSITNIKQSGTYNNSFGVELNIPSLSRASAVTSEVENLPGKVIYKPIKPISTFGINLVPKQL